MKRSQLLSFLLLLLSPFQVILAQSSLDELDSQQYFDFWVGQWDLNWQDAEGNTATGTNQIEKILDDKVLLENFQSTSGQMEGYEGKSFSVYDEGQNQWRQTWVDDTSDYITFIGQFDGNKRMFVNHTTDSNGNEILRRMVFYDIQKDSFTWDWESSKDGGQSWTLNWRIHYERK